MLKSTPQISAFQRLTLLTSNLPRAGFLFPPPGLTPCGFSLSAMKNLLNLMTREHVGLAFMAVGFACLMAGIAAHFTLAVAAMVGGGLLLAAGVAIDRMS